jgi:hypothetical protein
MLGIAEIQGRDMTSISSIPQHPEPRAQFDAGVAPAESEASVAASPAEEAGDAGLAADPGEPEDMQAKLDRLIDSQAESGALSGAQAKELRSFFAQRIGGEVAAQRGSAPESAAPTRPISEAATRQLDAMSAFLDKLRNAAASGSITYGSNSGTSSNGSSATGWVIDTKA